MKLEGEQNIHKFVQNEFVHNNEAMKNLRMDLKNEQEAEATEMMQTLHEIIKSTIEVYKIHIAFKYNKFY